MPQQPETVTDRLVNVIQVIQLGRKTGQLSVERGDGGAYEEGFISFVHGQVTQATTGQRSGLEALNWLSGWGECRFTFTPATETHGTSPLPAVSARSSQSLRSAQPVHPAQSAQAASTSPQHAYAPGGIGSQTGNLRAAPRTRPLPSVPHTPEPASNGFSSAPSSPAAPYRTRRLEEALRILEYRGLSRVHRHLLLLIDGQRTTAELVRLIGRDQNEVTQLLRDLVDAAVIKHIER